jgi:hypothetical protein
MLSVLLRLAEQRIRNFEPSSQDPAAKLGGVALVTTANLLDQSVGTQAPEQAGRLAGG